jgi:hypothetical protein
LQIFQVQLLQSVTSLPCYLPPELLLLQLHQFMGNLSLVFIKYICKNEPVAGFPNFLNATRQKPFKELIKIRLLPIRHFNSMPVCHQLAGA